jgi:zinc/manganese transport system permease protein
VILDPFQFAFMIHALEAATAVSILAGVVGWLTVLRREIFAGHTLSVMAFPGAAGATLAGVPVAWGYLAACTAAALVLGPGTHAARRGFRDQTALVGTVQAVGLSLGLVALSVNGSVQQDLEPLLFGSIVGISAGRALSLAVLTVVLLALLATVGRPLLLTSVDPALARSRGLPVGLLSGGFLVILGVAVAAASQVTGALLVFALLIMPAGCARQLTSRPGPGLGLSVGLGLTFSWVGLELAYYTDYPLGFYVSSLGLSSYVTLRLLARRRGARASGATAPGEAR